MSRILQISDYIIPFIVGIIMIYGIKDNIKIFDLFIEGAKDGIKVSLRLFPTLIGIFFSIGMLRNSGIIELVTNITSPILNIFKIPTELVPLALIRPISGSGAIGVATDIMKKNGVDSYIGNTASVIMGSTETTLYTIAVYTSGLKSKKSNRLLMCALIADIVGMVSAVFFCRILS